VTYLRNNGHESSSLVRSSDFLMKIFN